MLRVAGGPHHVLLLLLVVTSLEPTPRTLPICHLANLPFVVCLASNKYSRAAASSDGSCIPQILDNLRRAYCGQVRYRISRCRVLGPELADDLQAFASLPAA